MFERFRLSHIARKDQGGDYGHTAVMTFEHDEVDLGKFPWYVLYRTW